MSKAVLMSIKPKNGKKILSGEKTIEMRKNAPADAEFIYETDRTVYLLFSGTGMVMGEFRLEGVRTTKDGTEFAEAACLTPEEMEEYGPGRDGLYRGWRVKEPKKFDTPIPLGEFFRPCSPSCGYISDCGWSNSGRCFFPIERPPQSWCYVEERN